MVFKLFLISSGCLWQVMIKLEPLVVMIGDKVKQLQLVNLSIFVNICMLSSIVI